MMHSMSVPPLRVRRNWFVGIKPDPVDHSHLDVNNGQVVSECVVGLWHVF